MIASIPLVLFGTASPSSNWYPECAYLVKWPMPRAYGLRRSTQRSLKKWIHSQSFVQGGNMSTAGEVTPADPGTPLRTYANAVQAARPGATLVSEKDVEPNAAPVVQRWIEHHQFPRGRKRTSSGVL